MLAPVAVTLQNHLRATVEGAGSGAGETSHEAAFRTRFLPQIQAALDGLQRPSEADVGRPDAIWAPLKRIRDALALELRCWSFVNAAVRHYGRCDHDAVESPVSKCRPKKMPTYPNVTYPCRNSMMHA